MMEKEHGFCSSMRHAHDAIRTDAESNCVFGLVRHPEKHGIVLDVVEHVFSELIFIGIRGWYHVC